MEYVIFEGCRYKVGGIGIESELPLMNGFISPTFHHAGNAITTNGRRIAVYKSPYRPLAYGDLWSPHQCPRFGWLSEYELARVSQYGIPTPDKGNL